MSKRDDLMAAWCFVEFVLERREMWSGEELKEQLRRYNVTPESMKRGVELIDAAIVRASREMRSGR